MFAIRRTIFTFGGADQWVQHAEPGLPGYAVSSGNLFEIVLDSRGGKVAGRVLGTEGNVWTGASLILVPDPVKGRLQSYWEACGQFLIRSVVPGNILLTWLGDAPCDAYLDSLERCPVAGGAGERDVHGKREAMMQYNCGHRERGAIV